MIFKTEGPTDLLALLSAGINQGDGAFCNVHGCKENPAETPFLNEVVAGEDVVVVHDRDKPGLEGANGTDGRPGWGPWLGKFAKSSTVIDLPYELAETKGKDLRDYFTDGNKAADLYAIVAESKPVSEESIDQDWVDEAEDDPHRLGRINLEKYKSEHDGRLVFWREEWWKWKGGQYRKIEISELKAKVGSSIRSEFVERWKERKSAGDDKPVKKVTRSLVSNVIGAMESICTIPSSIPMPCWLPDRTQPNFVAVQNGILDLEAVFEGKENVLRKHTEEWFSSFCLDYRFDPSAKCPLWMKFVASAMQGDLERISVLQEWAGYLLTSKNNLQRFLALEGEGSNGKTVFFSAMTAMLGDQNVSHVPLERFSGQFDLMTTIGKSANVCSDVGEIDRVAEAELKQFSGGDVMQFDRKNREPISIRPTAKLMMSWNRRPHFRDRSDGLWRRMLLVPFEYKPAQDQIIRGMDDADWWIENGEVPGILNWAIAGLHRLREQQGFTESSKQQDAILEYQLSSNPALEFLDTHVAEADGVQIEKQELYDAYRKFCQKAGVQRPLAKRSFSLEVFKKFPSSKSGKTKTNEFGERKNSYSGIGFKVVPDMSGF